jgi:hypothetical protein
MKFTPSMRNIGLVPSAYTLNIGTSFRQTHLHFIIRCPKYFPFFDLMFTGSHKYNSENELKLEVL